MGKWAAFVAFALALVCSRATHADLIVTIEDEVILPGEAGTVDVYVSGDDETILGFDLNFVIDRGDSISKLFFAESQDSAYTTDPDYVLFGLDPLPVVDDYPSERIELDINDEVGFDEPEAVVSDQRLLARLSLENPPLTDPTLASKDVFTITVTASFYNLDGNFPDVMGSGTVLTVPEPSTLGLLVAGIAMLAGTSWRRRRRRELNSATSEPTSAAG